MLLSQSARLEAGSEIILRFLWVPARGCRERRLGPHGLTGVASAGQRNERLFLELAQEEAVRKEIRRSCPQKTIYFTIQSVRVSPEADW